MIILPSYGTRPSIIGPLAVRAAASPATGYHDTLEEWTQASIATLRTRPSSYDASRCNQEGVNVRRPMCRYLLGCDGRTNVRHITSWHSQDCLLQGIMTVRGKQLSTDSQNGVTIYVLVSSRLRGDDGIVQNELLVPKKTLAPYGIQ